MNNHIDYFVIDEAPKAFRDTERLIIYTGELATIREALL